MLTTLADNKTNLAQMMESDIEKAENLVGKGENAGNINFSFSYNVF